MKTLLKILGLILLALAFISPTYGQINAASCSAADVQTAINVASTGQTVNVPAGNCTWGLNAVTLSKAITLNLAGTGVTTGSDATSVGGATTNCPSGGTCLTLTGNPSFTVTNTSGNIRIQNGAWIVNGNNNLPHPVVMTGAWPPSGAIIWTGNVFTMTGSTLMDNELAGGVILSGNTFNGNWNDFLMTIKDDTHFSSWESVADTMGTRDTTGLFNNYFETNTVNGGSNGILDCDDDCRIVVRNNTFNESGAFNSHGDDTSPVGARHYEIYTNAFNFPDQTCANGNASLSNINQYIWLRGGTGVVYNNTMVALASSCWGTKSEVRGSIRGAEAPLAFLPPTYMTRIASCGAVSYPVPNQLGQNFNGTSLFTDPIYVWANIGTVSFSSGWGWGNPCGFTWSTFFQWGRDAINTTVGTNTCGNGCTVNATGGTAKPGYAPYTYPHPLIGGAGIAFAPGSLAFGTVLQHVTSPGMSTTLTNSSGGSITFTSTTFTGTNGSDFAASANTCTGTLVNSATCTVTVKFTPSAAINTAETATLNVAYTGFAGSPLTVALTGTSGGIIVSPTSLAFGTVTRFTTSSGISTVLTNNAGVTITGLTSAISGTNASDFSFSVDGCSGISVVNGGTCTDTVLFSPTASPTTVESATLSINFSGASGSPELVTLGGTSGAPGAAATPSCAPGTGSYGSPQSVTCSVAGGAPVICYTTNGATPATNSTSGCTTGTLVSGAISIIVNTSLKVIAGGTGFTDGSVATFVYTFTTAPPPAPCTTCQVTIPKTTNTYAINVTNRVSFWKKVTQSHTLTVTTGPCTCSYVPLTGATACGVCPQTVAMN
jgi:hypothetical protein